MSLQSRCRASRRADGTPDDGAYRPPDDGAYGSPGDAPSDRTAGLLIAVILRARCPVLLDGLAALDAVVIDCVALEDSILIHCGLS